MNAMPERRSWTGALRVARESRRAVGAAALMLALIGTACDPQPQGRAASEGLDSVDAGDSEDAVLTATVDTLLEANGTRLFVHREGAGEPVIVVHGGPLLDHGYMAGPLRPLADSFTLVYYDQRLSGRSDGTVDSASVSLDAFVGDIDAIRSALGFGRVHVLGHSWGGLLAMSYALAHPDRVRSLVLVSPMAPSFQLWRQEERALADALAPADTAGMGALRGSQEVAAGAPAAVERLLRLAFRSQLHDPALADSLRFHVPDDYRERSRQFGYIMGDLQDYDLRDGLERLPVPTLVLYGADEVGGARVADTLEALIPGAVTESIRDAGHFAFLERPAAFLPVVRRFLNGAGREPGRGTR